MKKITILTFITLFSTLTYASNNYSNFEKDIKKEAFKEYQEFQLEQLNTIKSYLDIDLKNKNNISIYEDLLKNSKKINKLKKCINDADTNKNMEKCENINNTINYKLIISEYLNNIQTIYERKNLDDIETTYFYNKNLKDLREVFFLLEENIDNINRTDINDFLLSIDIEEQNLKNVLNDETKNQTDKINALKIFLNNAKTIINNFKII